MRIFYLLVLVVAFSMCKTKDVIPTDQRIKYVVILEEKASPKEFNEVIPFEVIESVKDDEKKANIWFVDFKASQKDNGKLRSSLLNHPKVISAMSHEDYQKMKNKKTQATKEGSMGKAGAAKQ